MCQIDIVPGISNHDCPLVVELEIPLKQQIPVGEIWGWPSLETTCEQFEANSMIRCQWMICGFCFKDAIHKGTLKHTV